MLMRFDPFRELDRLTEDVWGTSRRGWSSMAMDAYREDDRFTVLIDMPGVNPDDIDLTVEKNVLTVSADRSSQVSQQATWVVSERPQGTFSRQLFLGEGLDVGSIEATYDRGVLTLSIPVSEQAKPRKVQITVGESSAQAIETSSQG
ncbi:MAG: Hsp20/alpha crystallin family protein [Actinomycetota bacterium]|nr:Hsp20/alpha crystallin family protein [Actinomycetota bacterium]